ncbi:MAG: A24 family peptidase [Clostridiales bacterium]|nr:A24 family peptidase [Clostridiales bacterium]
MAGLLTGLAAEWLVRRFLMEYSRAARMAGVRAAFIMLCAGWLTAGVYTRFGLSEKLILYALLILLLLAAGLIDLYLQILPNVVVLPGFLAGLGYYSVKSVLEMDARPLAFSVFGALAGGAVLFLVIRVSRGGMGLGDMKFLMMIGAFMGPVNSLIALTLAVILGGALGVILIAARVANRKTPVPFGPFLAVGALTMIFYDAPIRQWLAGA